MNMLFLLLLNETKLSTIKKNNRKDTVYYGLLV